MRLVAVLLVFVAACDRSPSPAPPDAGKPAPSASTTNTLRVIDSGSEPREQPLQFVFSTGSTESGRLVIDSRLERAGVVISDEHLEVTLHIRYLSADKVELVVKQVKTNAPDIKHIETTIGSQFVQKIYPSGELEPPEPSYPPGADPVTADYVRGAVVQIASNFLPVLPKEPVGTGARWSLRDLRFSLTERRGDKWLIERRAEIHGERMTGSGMAMAHEEQLYRIEAISNGLARRVEAELKSESPPGTKRTTRMAFEISPPRECTADSPLLTPAAPHAKGVMHLVPPPRD